MATVCFSSALPGRPMQASNLEELVNVWNGLPPGALTHANRLSKCSRGSRSGVRRTRPSLVSEGSKDIA
eukprot:scaffold214252_cov18-Tisochrysis_lutea.AAC.1